MQELSRPGTAHQASMVPMEVVSPCSALGPSTSRITVARSRSARAPVAVIG
jgi:hypothetical protein